VLPSLYEGFGFSILEAMASGTPVIGSNAASIPEVMGDGGILFDPHSYQELEQTLERVLDDTTLRSHMIQKGFENIRRFSWETCGERTCKIYTDIL
jgi:glycosyltransferase involved in cell wall biosynthesis